jgi:hypothetical protein
VSAVERKPAQLVAQPLVVEHKFSDLVGELRALPLALQAASRLALVFSRCRPRRPDRVGRSTELVGRHMAHRRGLAGSVRGMPCCPTQVSGRGVCMAGRRAGLSPRDLTPRPGTPEVDRPTWTVVLRPCLLEVVQHVLRAVSCPDRQKAVIIVLEAAAATHSDEPRIPDLGEDHQLPISPLCPPRVAGSASDEPASYGRSVTLPRASVMTDKERGQSQSATGSKSSDASGSWSTRKRLASLSKGTSVRSGLARASKCLWTHDPAGRDAPE